MPLKRAISDPTLPPVEGDLELMGAVEGREAPELIMLSIASYNRFTIIELITSGL